MRSNRLRATHGPQAQFQAQIPISMGSPVSAALSLLRAFVAGAAVLIFWSDAFHPFILQYDFQK